MIRQRVRVRFCKAGDLRLTSHRDLARTFERMFRRADLRLSMSEGFHPKARMNFPLPLSLGIAGLDEVMEFDLAEELADDEVLRRLREQAPPGLEITRLEHIPPGRRNKARVCRVSYEMAVPHQRRAAVQAAMEQLQRESTVTIQRSGGRGPVDLLEYLNHWELTGDTLRFRLQVEGQSGVRPREVLAALGLDDLEPEGHFLTRTEVEIAG